MTPDYTHLRELAATGNPDHTILMRRGSVLAILDRMDALEKARAAAERVSDRSNSGDVFVPGAGGETFDANMCDEFIQLRQALANLRETEL